MPKKRQSRSQVPAVYEFRIDLLDITPSVWRQVLVPAASSLDVLHAVIQELFGWQDYHLYRFEYRDREFERPDAESAAEDATRTTLMSLGLTTGASLLYTYDFGDDWHHEVRLLKPRVFDAELTYPVCVGGARAGPPEDSGGPPGYERLLGILADPAHPELLEMRAWAGSHFHPETFDLRATNRILQLAFH